MTGLVHFSSTRLCYYRRLSIELLGSEICGDVPGNRRAILNILPANDRLKWFNIQLVYGNSSSNPLQRGNCPTLFLVHRCTDRVVSNLPVSVIFFEA
jgi:hypothetical protein